LIGSAAIRPEAGLDGADEDRPRVSRFQIHRFKIIEAGEAEALLPRRNVRRGKARPEGFRKICP